MEVDFSEYVEKDICHTPWEERVKCNIISNPVVTDAKVFFTTIIGAITRVSCQKWQSITRTASKRGEIDLVKQIRRDVKMGNSLINLIIEIHWVRFRCTTNFSNSFRKGLRQYPRAHEKDLVLHMIMPWSTSPESSEWRIAYSDSGCTTRRWLNQVYSEVAAGACWKREEDMNTVCSTTANRRWPITRIDPYSYFSKVANPRTLEDTSLNFEKYWNPKHPEGIAIKIKISTSCTKILESEGQRWIPVLKRVQCSPTKITQRFRVGSHLLSLHVMHMRVSHVTHVNESYHTCEWVMLHMRMGHVTRVTESCHTYRWMRKFEWVVACWDCTSQTCG